MSDPSQVLDVLRDVLLEHMDSEPSLPHYRVQSAVYVDLKTNRVGTLGDLPGPIGLRLTMRDGSEYLLALSTAD